MAMRRFGYIMALAICLAPMPALAVTQSYRVDAYSSTTIELQVCSDVVDLTADGDNDTDLDYWVYDAAGNLVTSDTDSTDLMYATLYRAAGDECTSFDLRVTNLGEVYNQFDVTLDARQTAGASVRSYRVDAYDTYEMDLSVCSPSLSIWINGDDDTDLDFYLYDPRGTLVFSDTDSTDLMIYTLESKAKPTACLPYRLEIVNLGSVYNQFEMQLTE